VSREPDHLVVEGHEHPEQITRLLAEKGIFVSELTAIRPTLESFFLRLTRPQADGLDKLDRRGGLDTLDRRGGGLDKPDRRPGDGEAAS
jgi:hypothetical protein